MKLVTMKSSLRYDGSVCVEVIDGRTTYSMIWNYRTNSKKCKTSRKKETEEVEPQVTEEEISSEE